MKTIPITIAMLRTFKAAGLSIRVVAKVKGGVIVNVGGPA